MIALTRNISSLQLPIALQAELKKNYDAYWISDVMETATEEGTSYYITLETADAQVILKSSGDTWNTFKKQRKS
jgi:phosphotransferase system HPr-like phosphotransfer protein